MLIITEPEMVRVASFFLSTLVRYDHRRKGTFLFHNQTWPEDLAYDSAAYMEDAVFRNTMKTV